MAEPLQADPASMQSITVLLAALIQTHPDPVALKTAFLGFARIGEQVVEDKTTIGSDVAFDKTYGGALKMIDSRIAAVRGR
ncbi:hypothetical protein BH10PSE17_BH10PSE17_26120 [soil metagenome]